MNDNQVHPEGIQPPMTEIERLRAEVAAWTETAERHAKNEAFYRALLDQVAAHLGPEVYVADSGDVMDSPLRLKIPEFVADLKRQLAEKTTELEAWQRIFGTTQLTHAYDRLETASRKLEQAILTLGDFKNFHRNLCNRFGYHHDGLNWQRDLASLEEHIAGQLVEARRETWDKAAKIVETHINHENFYHGMVETCLEEAAKEIRAEAEKELAP